jgi:hypothetical protein
MLAAHLARFGYEERNRHGPKIAAEAEGRQFRRDPWFRREHRNARNSTLGV